MNISAELQLHPLMASEEMMFENLFANLAFLLPWHSIKFNNLDTIHLFDRGLTQGTFLIRFAVR